MVLDCPEGMFSKVMVPFLLFFEVHFIFGFFYSFHPQKIDLGILKYFYWRWWYINGFSHENFKSDWGKVILSEFYPSSQSTL